MKKFFLIVLLSLFFFSTSQLLNIAKAQDSLDVLTWSLTMSGEAFVPVSDFHLSHKPDYAVSFLLSKQLAPQLRAGILYTTTSPRSKQTGKENNINGLHGTLSYFFKKVKTTFFNPFIITSGGISQISNPTGEKDYEVGTTLGLGAEFLVDPLTLDFHVMHVNAGQEGEGILAGVGITVFVDVKNQ